MRILVIGGTGFVGRHVVQSLADASHEIIVFHRGKTKSSLSPHVLVIHGDRRRLDESAEEFSRLRPEVVIDVNPYTGPDAAAVMRAFRDIAKRVVALSSGDVYRAYERFHRAASEPPDPIPLREDAPLRERFYPYRSAASGPRDMRYHYEKILVERAVLGEPRLPGTVLRLPMIHGPGDRQHRLFPYLKRMDDGRAAILLEKTQSEWRCTRGYVENVAAAVATVAADERAAGQIYNVGERDAPTETEWVTQIGGAGGWAGRVAAVDREFLPPHLAMPVDWRHHLVTDTSRLREQFNFIEPVSRDEGLRRTIAWERTHAPSHFRPEQFDYQAEDAALALSRLQPG
ncbi:MAG: NAD-dependent epimerase/dehydratase family protein [Gammaproteobacteria bacterium]|nr:NAD-dependent epimerase/dehydratase family protein [Gammaproteobacteria bacterium]